MKKIKNIVLPGSKKLPVLLDIFFEDDGIPKPVVMYAHGFNGFKDWGNGDLVAEPFFSAGFTFIKFNFSHNGTTLQNPEEFKNLDAFAMNNYTIELEDLKHVVNWIYDESNPYKNSINKQQLYLIGHSLGAGISILFASEDDRIKKLITWASVSECKTPWGSWPAERITEWKKKGVEYYLNGRTQQQMPMFYQLYENYYSNEERLDIKKAIASLSIPVLICHGTLDASVPVEKAFELKQWQPAAKMFTVESDHVFGRKHPWAENSLPIAMQQVISASIQFLQ